MKNWILKNIQIDMLFHYIFGIWFGGAGFMIHSSWCSIMISTTVIAFSKEIYDYYDYSFFSWKDILFTYFGGITVLILLLK